MRTKTINLSIPKNLLIQADKVAKRQDRSRSELLREALRSYLTQTQRWERVFAYGRKKARELGLKSEEDVYKFLERT